MIQFCEFSVECFVHTCMFNVYFSLVIMEYYCLLVTHHALSAKSRSNLHVFSLVNVFISACFKFQLQRLKEQLKLHQAAQSNNIIHRAMTEAVDMVTSQHNEIPSPGNHINHSQNPSTIVANSNITQQDIKRGNGSS